MICVETQETGSSNIITFSSYYDGCVPVLIINLLPTLVLMYKQDRFGNSECVII